MTRSCARLAVCLLALAHLAVAGVPCGSDSAAPPDGGFVAAWNEEEFPSLRTVVARLALRE